MKASITIKMDNAAFDDSGELARILRDLADKVCFTQFEDAYDRNLNLRDINGNTVGAFKVTGRRNENVRGNSDNCIVGYDFG